MTPLERFADAAKVSGDFTIPDPVLRKRNPIVATFSSVFAKSGLFMRDALFKWREQGLTKLEERRHGIAAGTKKLQDVIRLHSNDLQNMPYFLSKVGIQFVHYVEDGKPLPLVDNVPLVPGKKRARRQLPVGQTLRDSPRERRFRSPRAYTEQTSMTATLTASDLTPQRVAGSTPEIIQFLEQTVWGSSGLLYHVVDYITALGRIPEPQFFILRDGGALIGTVMFFLKPVALGTRRATIAYLTQLSVRPDQRGRGLAGILVRAVLHHVQEIAGGEPTGITAYIEEANAPSLAVFRKLGFFDAGTFCGTVINRLHPKSSARTGPLHAAETAGITRALTTLYEDHWLTDVETSLHADDYRVIRDEHGAILAGVQAHLEEWRVTAMEGIEGWLIMKGLARSPWIRNHLFNPAHCAVFCTSATCSRSRAWNNSSLK